MNDGAVDHSVGVQVAESDEFVFAPSDPPNICTRAVRQLNSNTGALLEAEPGELDLLFVVLDELFDVYYVKPAQLAEKKAALNAKLKAAGKQTI